MQVVYIVSGPPGVGKTTISEQLAKAAERSELVTGDKFLIPLKNSGLTFEQILEETWQKILSSTLEILRKNSNVVIDFVVEDELPWFYKHIANENTQIKYVVLLADEKTILKQLEKKNELNFKDRALFLLDKLGKDPANDKYIYDITNKEVAEVVQEIIKSARYVVD